MHRARLNLWVGTLAGALLCGSLSANAQFSTPTVSKAFNPAAVAPGQPTTLTITLVNRSILQAALTAPFVDALPSGVVIATVPNAGTTCPGPGAVIAAPGGSTVTLPATHVLEAGFGSHPPPPPCTVSVDVMASACGTFVNTIPANALQTTNGDNADAAVATLVVNCVGPPYPTADQEPIPALSGFAMVALVLLLGWVGVAVLRSRGA